MAPIQCAVCYETFHFPYTTRCGHAFCDDCLRQWTAGCGHRSCPICRARIDQVEDEPRLAHPNLDRYLVLEYVLSFEKSFYYLVSLAILVLFLASDSQRSIFEFVQDISVAMAALGATVYVLMQLCAAVDFTVVACCVGFIAQVVWYRTIYPLVSKVYQVKPFVWSRSL
ncbi:unnamed protein product [Aphanomyces euteiches]|uniref:RING-type E3 ubiquitin transferase n=1 Tax=Aphanomyces euteiches TaxID=100861 RepID=A0A6G0W7N2_9STRA|nr:hypothetical protein Ae201684_018357 [Aphanomyces euteiches]KAH9097580.1 hypothetical protein Ae201684P_001056 [Aphanomyces euteiches]KAH9155864.1 hypothetical protein AeRB84_002189 [Aphanomyces euteiches]